MPSTDPVSYTHLDVYKRQPQKTRMVHIDDGFDFLGFTIRRMRRRGSNKWFVYTRPAKKAIASIKARVKTMTYRATLHLSLIHI